MMRRYLARYRAHGKIKNETGFTVIHGLMALAVIFIVGFAGWYVSRSQADKQGTATSTNAQKRSTDNNQNGAALPKDWTWYENKDFGFKFAYPKVFGNFSLVTEYCCGLTKMDFPNFDSQYKSESPKDSGITGVKDDFLLDVYKLGVTEIQSRKYGPKVHVMPNDGRWVVTQPNPADPAQYREGMIYNEVTESKSKDNVTVYTFVTGDEGIIDYQLVFIVKSQLYMLTLPNFDTGKGLGDGPARPNDQKPYDTFRDQVIKNIALIH